MRKEFDCIKKHDDWQSGPNPPGFGPKPLTASKFRAVARLHLSRIKFNRRIWAAALHPIGKRLVCEDSDLLFAARDHNFEKMAGADPLTQRRGTATGFSCPQYAGSRTGPDSTFSGCRARSWTAGCSGGRRSPTVIKKKNAERMRSAFYAPLTNNGALYIFLNEPPGTRTQNPRLKRPLLYQLS